MRKLALLRLALKPKNLFIYLIKIEFFPVIKNIKKLAKKSEAIWKLGLNQLTLLQVVTDLIETDGSN